MVSWAKKVPAPPTPHPHSYILNIHFLKQKLCFPRYLYWPWKIFRFAIPIVFNISWHSVTSICSVYSLSFSTIMFLLTYLDMHMFPRWKGAVSEIQSFSMKYSSHSIRNSTYLSYQYRFPAVPTYESFFKCINCICKTFLMKKAPVLFRMKFISYKKLNKIKSSLAF